MGAGRPTKYDPEEHPIRGNQLALLGLTNEEISEALDIGLTTFDRWMSEHDKFRGAIKEGKVIADAKVANSLYNRAIGSQVFEERVIDGEIRTLAKTLPPDTMAASLWLRNRQPQKWRDKQEIQQDITSGGEKLELPMHTFVKTGD